MCDTIVATGSATADGATLFGKNSDREPNEAQYVVNAPGRAHPEGAVVRCTYMTIPQVARTNAVLLSKPFWMWGAEMGVNEHGLAIGNEAVFTRVSYRQDRGLTGMDLLRLGLERAATAREAVAIITGLLETHGQGGNCGYEHKLYYHNSFLLADSGEAWVLETAGRQWAARKIDGVYAISNRLTIEDKWDLSSDDLVALAVRKGWCRSAADFSFARCYSDFLYTTFSASRHRRNRAMILLEAREGVLATADFMAILRDHGGTSFRAWSPARGLMQSQICNHAGWGPVRVSQTTGSMVSHLGGPTATHFFTGTAAPCTGIFKPLWVDTPRAWPESRQTEAFDHQSLFWQHERLHRLTIGDYHRRVGVYAEARDGLEADFTNQALSVRPDDKVAREALARGAYERASENTAEWFRKVQADTKGKKAGWFFDLAWQTRNRKAGVAI